MNRGLSRVRGAARSLAAAPALSMLAVVAFALGVGANAAIFSVVRGVLLAPLPYAQPERLVQVWTQHVVSPELYTQLRERLSGFEHLDASQTVALTLLGDDEAVEIPGGRVSGSHFAMLAVQPALGRALNEADERPGAESVIVLGHGLWQGRFGGDPAVLGRQVRLGDGAHPTRTVVGVMPADLRPLETSWQAWIPLPLDPSDEEGWSHNYGLKLHARLGANRDVAAATARLRAVATRLAAERGDLFLREPESASVAPLLEVTVGDVRTQLLLLAGAVALVLLVACANVANLLLTRAVARRRELAIRSALGATRGHLARQLLGESALIGVIGGAAGVLMASWLVRSMSALPVDVPRADGVRVDAAVLGFALALGLATSLLSGLVPALRASRADLQGGLVDGARSGAGPGRQRLHGALVTLEVALAVVLVVGAGLLLRSVWQLQRVDPGFRYESVLALRLSPPPSRYATGPALTGFYERVLERLRRVPGVESAGATSLLPLGGGRMGVGFELDGVPPPPGRPLARADYAVVSGELFQALGVPLVRGRWLTTTDGASPRPAPALVSRAFAEEFFPGDDPIGHRLTGDGEEWLRIVGVVGDIRSRQLETSPRSQIYVPHGHEPLPRLYLAIRTAGDPVALSAAVRAAVSEVDPLVPITRVSPMSEVVSRSMARARVFTGLLAGFALLALLLGAMGIYGVVSYGVSQRTREIGVRMALGASRGAVLREVLRGGLQPVGLGLVAGLLAAAGGGRLLAGYLYQVSSLDPMTFACVGLGTLLVGAAAALGPARRGARLDPIEALRAE